MKQRSLGRRVLARDRQWHPEAYSPTYKTTFLRSPKQALVSIAQSTSELTAPDFSHMKMDKWDNDLVKNFDHGGLPIGERMLMHGFVFDQYGQPVPKVLIEIWQANACGRYRHINDYYTAPLDPNFSGVGRTLTDNDGHYCFHTIKPGAYPWPNGSNSWRPSHIHVSLIGPTLASRLVTQMYFQGDPLIPLCPIIHTIKQQAAIDTLVNQLDMATSNPMDCLAYRFDIILRGEHQTYFEHG